MQRTIRCLCLAIVSSATQADDTMRLDTRLTLARPELATPGSCVVYREGGAGWLLTEPVYWLKGTTVSYVIKRREVTLCPDAGNKPISRYTREEFNRLAAQQPCVARIENSHERDIAVLRLRIEDWETPFERRAANAGRLYRGHYLDQMLTKGAEIELDSDLLDACS